MPHLLWQWPERAVLSVPGGGRGQAGGMCPQRLLNHSSQACKALASLSGPRRLGVGGESRVWLSASPPLRATAGGQAHPHGLCCSGPASACCHLHLRLPSQREAL